MPILGIIASSFRSAAGPEGAYDSLATVTVGATSVSSITFAGIPSGYKHLQIRYISRCTRADVWDVMALRFNGDTAANYTRHYLYGTGAAVSASANTAVTYSEVGNSTGSTAAANIFATGIIDILDYASTNKNKTIRALNGDDRNGAGDVYFASGLWFKTPEAVTSITLLAQAGSASFTQYSTFALYGIK